MFAVTEISECPNHTYGNNQWVDFGYDKYGRLTSKSSSVGNDFYYGYDKTGALTHVYWGMDDSKKFYYDLIDRLSEVVTSAMYFNTHTLRFTYDDKNRVSTMQNEIAGRSSNTIRYDYGSASKITGIKLNDVQQISYQYDRLQRLQTRTLPAAGNYTTKYSYLNQGSQTTTLLSTLQNGSDVLSYTYDNMGNITEIYKNDILQVKYTYDRLSQLTREDNKARGITITYSYDKGGNILSRKQYAYTTAADLTGLSYTQTGSYGYDATWKDKLVSYNGQSLSYDEIGNPLTYRDGMTMTWEDGRKLSTLTKTGLSVEYAYDDSGIRNMKNVNDERTLFYLNGSSIVRQEKLDENNQYEYGIDFFYDANGDLFGFEYANNKYYYVRNGQNDITGILDSSGAQVVSYEYDTWGMLLDITGDTTLGVLNPFRYRGYYYDGESGLYSLSSRYYDAVIGRFINADEQINDGSILGANLFSYCYNNPVNMVDYDGREPITLTCMGIYFLATAVIALCTVAVVSTPEFQRSWSQMCTAVAGGISSGLGALGGAMSGAISWASTQAKSIAKSIGDSFAKTRTKPKYRTPGEWHHIVAQQAPNASYAAKILREVLPGGTQNPENLMYIKTGLHRRLHTNAYYGWANSIVISAYNAANGNKAQQTTNVIAALRTIRAYVERLNAVAPF